MNTKKRLFFIKLLHLPLPLSLIELQYELECLETLPWTNEKFCIRPYLAYEKKKDGVYIYGDPHGIAWQRKHAGIYHNEKEVWEKIYAYFDPIKPLLKEEKAIANKNDFLNFLEKVKQLWPWLNYIWWGIEWREQEQQDFSELLKMRKYTEYFAPGMMAVLKKTIALWYPSFSDFADVILLSEALENKIPNKLILKNRQKTFAYTNNTLYKSWEDLQKDFPIYREENIKKNQRSLSGTIAFHGKARGYVKKISCRSDMFHFNEGNILVASTTTPDYMPVIKKSRAIISEHGGSLSHASIVSRELGIPCIVGVSHATQVLNDGDLVEVDADNGVVRILERAEDNE